jgi:pimeloyl-ACP methyl ester carboxylesterase
MNGARTIEVDGTSLYVEDHGSGTPVLLIHGWPDSGRLWRNQVPFLAGHGFRVIVPDMRGLGRSGRPARVEDYALPRLIGDVAAILDAHDVAAAHVVGHDWGAGVAWFAAMYLPDRLRSLTVLSVGHPSVPQSLRQREMAWYQLLFQFEGTAEAIIQYNDWAWLREFTRGDGDLDRYIEDLSRPGALTASLNWYRANLAPRLPGAQREFPQVTAPTLGVWSTNDYYLDGDRMANSGAFVAGPWRHEVVPDVSHWIPLDAPALLNDLLLDWLTAH